MQPFNLFMVFGRSLERSAGFYTGLQESYTILENPNHALIRQPCLTNSLSRILGRRPCLSCHSLLATATIWVRMGDMCHCISKVRCDDGANSGHTATE